MGNQNAMPDATQPGQGTLVPTRKVGGEGSERWCILPAVHHARASPDIASSPLALKDSTSIGPYLKLLGQSSQAH